MNIVLIGFMGTGKTHVGSALAERLGWDFRDTDGMIESEVGVPIADIFVKRGETAFRVMESAAVKLVSLLDKTVIATGGGVPLREENMRELSRGGIVVHLSAKPETIYNRVKSHIHTRPLLKGPDPLGAIQDLLDARGAAYGRARHSVATDGLTTEQIIEKIIALIPAKEAGA